MIKIYNKILSVRNLSHYISEPIFEDKGFATHKNCLKNNRIVNTQTYKQTIKRASIFVNNFFGKIKIDIIHQSFSLLYTNNYHKVVLYNTNYFKSQ